MPAIKLLIDTAPPTYEEFAGWKTTCFEIAAAARDSKERDIRPRSIPPDAVLELELDNGTRLLVAAEDAERYLGQALGRDDEAATIRVGRGLRLSGPHLPAGPARDGVGAWTLKSLRIHEAGAAGMTALVLAGSFQDSQLDNRLGLHRLSLDAWGLTPVPAMPASPEPVLLFVHGTASSCGGSFRGLWGGEGAEADVRERLRELYGDRVYGFEHRSLTESPVANALELAKALPDGARLHLVSHSRGGMVGELLARANRIGTEPFAEPDIARFLAHAERTGRHGGTEEAARLRELGRVLRKKKVRVERFVRVAATARGTTLASGRLDRWASVMLNLLGGGLALVPGLATAAKVYDVFKSFLLAVVKERTDARILPGLEAMMPDSPLVALLNAPDVELDSPLHVIAGDYEGDGFLSWLGDCLSESFYGGATDLVVNTPSMSGGAPRRQGIWLKALAGPKVHHFSYFDRKESVLPLLEALAGGSDGFEALAAPSRVELARGGIHTKPLAGGPIALMLPGIMGSHLAIGRDRIWFDPANMIAGEMSRLHVNAAGVVTDGWMDMSYERFAQHLAMSHEVRPFPYDWRLSITAAAAGFGAVLDAAMAEAESRGKPLRIVAHSMGGLVARLALQGRWHRFKAIPGSRLVQFGTPNLGSHSIAAVLMGRDGFVQNIERWADWKNDMREFLDIVSRFPGVLELLPWPVKDGRALDGLDYFDPALWAAWCGEDAENRDRRNRSADTDFERAKGAGDGWPAPEAAALKAAREAVAAIMAAPLDPECTRYVAGSDKTPVAVRLADGQVDIAWTRNGDGRVPWRTGIPPGVRAWCVDEAHGSLLNYADAFDEYVTLIETGECRLTPVPEGTRGTEALVFAPAPLAVHTLYPTTEEVVAAALGGRKPRRGKAAAHPPTVIEIIHGSLAGAETPVLIGAYANDPLRGSASFLDRILGGALARAQTIDRYPREPGDAAVFLQANPGAKPGGAVVVGLGQIAELKPGALARALAHGLMEYARLRAESRRDAAAEPLAIDIACLLVGTGFGGLSVPLGVRALMDALHRANSQLDLAHMNLRFATVRIYEEEESRAIAAAQALRHLLAEGRNAAQVHYDGRIAIGSGGYRGACDGGDGDHWERVHVTAGSKAGGLRFTLVTDRARAEVDDQPDQRQAVDGLLQDATATCQDQPGLSRALFELMIPNGFKAALADVRGVILAVDDQAAVYPWELMRDKPAGVAAPLATQIGLVRQLATPHGRGRVRTVDDERLLVVADTNSGYAVLPGAQREGETVARLFQSCGYAVNLLRRPAGQEVYTQLFDGCYRVIHIAAHGVVATGPGGPTGIVLGGNTYLVPAQIAQLRRVPEVVFINCCHQGSMALDAGPRCGNLAAGVATQFIELGCKAVIAAGWAVDDAAAETFAGTFWQALLAGSRFGDAVLQARAAAYARHPGTNTWGAYQAYGDERFRLVAGDADRDPPDFVHAGQAAAALARLQARIAAASADEHAMYRRQLAAMDNALHARHYGSGAVREHLGAAWADLGETAVAIDHYRAALATEDGRSSLHALEQLANLEVRHGERLARDKAGRKQGLALMTAGTRRIDALLALGPTVERLSLKASLWKRRAGTLEATGASEEERLKAISEMTHAYNQAAVLSRARNGEPDYYPLLNAMEGAILLGPPTGKARNWRRRKTSGRTGRPPPAPTPSGGNSKRRSSSMPSPPSRPGGRRPCAPAWGTGRRASRATRRCWNPCSTPTGSSSTGWARPGNGTPSPTTSPGWRACGPGPASTGSCATPCCNSTTG
ncbi:MAG: CHAT domain-containing protein [Sterolibacteriaceae bacterium MAG5]|nr:CHAT domain-containing protein [Candidatus Nitricoxidireducens bremensis]